MKKNLIIFALLAVLLFVFGCSKDSQNMYGMASASRSRAAAYGGEAFEVAANVQDMLAEEERGSEAANLIDQDRKLIKQAYVRIRVENLEAADISVSGLLEKYNAYAASTNIEENSRRYSLRVPAQYYDIFLSDMDGMGRLIQRNESTEDVSLRYYDLEGRLATKRELLMTFQSYLGKANNIEEILAVEQRIAELQYDIESTGIQLRNLGNRVDYSTIDLFLLGPIAQNPTRGLTLGERIKQLFGGFGNFLSLLIIIVIGIILFGIPRVLILFFLYWLLFGKIGLIKKLIKRIK
jgi:hypothetical protein